MNETPGILALPSPTRHLIAEKEGVIGRVIFNKPVRMNAVSLDMWQALPQLLTQLDADRDVKVILLRGAGDKAFISGADLSQSEDVGDISNEERQYGAATAQAFRALESVSKPTIAQIQGVCLGGGLAIASACDLRYAGDGSTFGIPAARLGLAYPPEAAQRLVNIVGPAFAKEIFFTAQPFSTSEALSMRLINRAFPSGDLNLFVHNICRTIAQNAPLTMKTAKLSIDTLVNHPDEAVAQELQLLVDLCATSQDYIEGRRAFMEKRKPVFRGI